MPEFKTSDTQLAAFLVAIGHSLLGLEGPQGKIVMVVNDKGMAEPRPVKVGDWAGDQWVINEGLKPGDKVIVDGVMKTRPGAPVKIAEAKPATEAQAPPPAAKQ